ncbi:exosome complex component RRP46-like [Zophobas morio]|uniref:exosome complex component RRP46-like n=1 Tax=Zophobas morio TaxID=2755281 RepID=UPI003082FE13
MLQAIAEEIIIRTLFPRTTISIVLQIIDHNGSLLSCCINAMALALVDAGVPLKCLFTAATCALLEGSDEEKLLLDPDLQEEQSSSCHATLCFCSNPKGAILATNITGVFGENEYFEICSALRKASQAIIEFMRLSLEKKMHKEIR